MSISDVHIIIKQHVLSTVETPLKSTRRIRYTCFEVSQNLLIFGATSGGIYIFKRDPCSFIQLIPSKDGSVTKVCMSKDERFIALSTSRGVACIFEWDVENGFKMVNRSVEHEGSTITELVWGDISNHLYIGDNVGRLSVINVSLFMNKSIFMLPAFVFMELGSCIVQISCFENYLLVSTETWSYICDTTREHYRQIGSRPRDGPFGSCFLKTSNGTEIFCARPGSRLWQVDLNGVVLSTRQFKKALATPPSRLILLDEEILEVQKKKNWGDQNLSFSYVTAFLNRYLFTYKEDGIYIFDPVNAKVVAWTDHFKDVVSAKCVNNAIYLWTTKSELHSLIVSPLDRCLLTLIFQEQYKLCFDLCEIYYDDIVKSEDLLTLSPLANLSDYPNRHIYENTRKLIDIIAKKADAKVLATRLDSGIFLVENRHWKKWKTNEPRVAPRRISRSSSVNFLENTVKIKKRYRSLPNIHISVDDTVSYKSISVPVSITKRLTLVDSEVNGHIDSPVNGVESDAHLVIRHSISQTERKEKKMKFNCDLLIPLIEDMKHDSSYWGKCFTLFDAIIDKYIEYNNNAPRKSKKVLQFSKLMPVECTQEIQKAIHSAISTGVIVTYLNSLSSSRSNTFDFPSHPPLLRGLHLEQDLKIDALLKNILFIFSDAVDPFTILQCLENSSMSCIYLSWCEVLDSFQDSAFSSATTINDDSDWPLPVLLNMLHLSLRVNQIDRSCQLALNGNVALYHASFICMKLVSHLMTTGLSLEESETKSDELFLRFISRMDEIDQVNFNKYFVSRHIEKAFVNVNSSSTLCRCGFPLPGRKSLLRFPKIGELLACNYLLKFKHRDVQDWLAQNSNFTLRIPEDSIRSVIKSPSENGIKFNSEFVVTKLKPLRDEHSETYYQLGGLLQVMPQLIEPLIKESSGQLKDLISFAVHLNAFKMWNEIILKAPDEFWSRMCELTLKFSQGVCPFGGEVDSKVNVDWSELTLTMLKSRGSDGTIELLAKCAEEIRPHELDERVFRLILLSKLLESRSSEKRKAILSAYSDLSVAKQFLIQDGLLDLDPSTVDLNTHTILQDNNFKWTVQFDSTSDVCSRCSLSLDSEELAKEGVRVFKCGHFYHIVCLKLAQSHFSCLYCSASGRK